MRLSLFLCAGVFCALGLGCTSTGLIGSTARNLLFEVRLCKENLQECLRDRTLADAAWHKFRKANPGHSFSRDFANGFKQGFADYLEAPGPGNPPPLPPPGYWDNHYRTSEGYFAIEDWFAGFRQGTLAAQESGAYNWICTSSVEQEANEPPFRPPVEAEALPEMPVPVFHGADDKGFH